MEYVKNMLRIRNHTTARVRQYGTAPYGTVRGHIPYGKPVDGPKDR